MNCRNFNKLLLHNSVVSNLLVWMINWKRKKTFPLPKQGSQLVILLHDNNCLHVANVICKWLLGWDERIFIYGLFSQPLTFRLSLVLFHAIIFGWQNIEKFLEEFTTSNQNHYFIIRFLMHLSLVWIEVSVLVI